MAEINLWLDSYDDIYSDFDNRHYLNRRISDDFLSELQIEIKNLPYEKNMVLLLPPEQRNESIENIIIDSLIKFFTRHFQEHHARCGQKLNKSIAFLIFGIIVMSLNSFAIYRLGESFFIIFLKVLLEPGGWFLLWSGLDFLLYDFYGLKKKQNFFIKH